MVGKSDNNRKVLMHDEQLKQGHFVGSLLFKPSGKALEDEALYYNIMQNNVLPEAFNELMDERYSEPQYTPKTTIQKEPQPTSSQPNQPIEPQPTPSRPIQDEPQPTPKQPVRPTPQSTYKPTTNNDTNNSSSGCLTIIIIIVVLGLIIGFANEIYEKIVNNENNTSSISESQKDEWYLQERNLKNLYYYVPFKDFVKKNPDTFIHKNEEDDDNYYSLNHKVNGNYDQYICITIMCKSYSAIEYKHDREYSTGLSKIETVKIGGYSWKKFSHFKANNEYKVWYEVEYNGIYYEINYEYTSKTGIKDDTKILDSLIKTIRFSK